MGFWGEGGEGGERGEVPNERGERERVDPFRYELDIAARKMYGFFFRF